MRNGLYARIFSTVAPACHCEMCQDAVPGLASWWELPVFCVPTIGKWMSGMDEFLSWRTSNCGWMEGGWGDGWMEGGHCHPRLELCVLRPPHRLLERNTQQWYLYNETSLPYSPHLVLIVIARPCLVSWIRVHANWLQKPIAKVKSKTF